jgi:hypothetical protein
MGTVSTEAELAAFSRQQQCKVAALAKPSGQRVAHFPSSLAGFTCWQLMVH